MELLRLLVKAGPNADLRRLVFSNFFLLLSFLEVDAAANTPSSPPLQTAATAASVTGDDRRHQRNIDLENKSGAGCGCAGGGGRGGEACGRRLYFASPVARLMGAVVDGDVVLVTSVSDEHLIQLTMAATGSR